MRTRRQAAPRRAPSTHQGARIRKDAPPSAAGNAPIASLPTDLLACLCKDVAFSSLIALHGSNKALYEVATSTDVMRARVAQLTRVRPLPSTPRALQDVLSHQRTALCNLRAGHFRREALPGRHVMDVADNAVGEPLVLAYEACSRAPRLRILSQDNHDLAHREARLASHGWPNPALSNTGAWVSYVTDTGVYRWHWASNAHVALTGMPADGVRYWRDDDLAQRQLIVGKSNRGPLVALYDVQRADPTSTWVIGDDYAPAKCAAFSHDGNTFVVSRSERAKVTFMDGRSRNPVALWCTGAQDINGLTFSHDDNHLMVSAFSGLHDYDRRAGKSLCVNSEFHWSTSYSPSGEWLLANASVRTPYVGDFMARMRVYEVANMERPVLDVGPNRDEGRIRFSADGSRVMLANYYAMQYNFAPDDRHR